MIAVLPLQNTQVLLLLMCAFGCNTDQVDQTLQETTQLSAWFHAADEREEEQIREQIDRFNTHQESITVALTVIPEEEYHDRIEQARHSGSLPDILEFDGPHMYEYAGNGVLMPLQDYLSTEVLGNLLPSVYEQGTYHGSLYSVAATDSALALYADRRRLEEVNARIPYTAADGWTLEEFNTLLADLANRDSDGAVLDLKLNYTGNWYGHAFTPVLLSAGADLIDRNNFSAVGVLNSDRAIGAFEQVQGWLASKYVDPNNDDAAFTSGRVALSWATPSHYAPYHEAIGENLVVVPLPDFGYGSLTGLKQWSLGVTTSCEAPEEAARFLTYLLSTKEVLRTSQERGTIPATREAIARSPLYGKGKPLQLFAKQLLDGHAVPQPVTPASPYIVSVFEEAIEKIVAKASVKKTLDEAVIKIESNRAETSMNYPR